MTSTYTEHNRLSSLKLLIICILSIIISTNAKAQYSNTLPQTGRESIEQKIAEAKYLYNNRFYSNALEQFNQLIEQGERLGQKSIINLEEIEAYRILSLIMLEKDGTNGLIKSYGQRYPHSSFIGKIKFCQAVLYFNRDDYARAGELFDTIDRRDLNREERDEYDFRKGYCQMRTGNTDAAVNTFNAIIGKGNGQYMSPSLYYCGYIRYSNKEFSGAIPLFERAKNDTRFAILSKYHILESKLMLKEYRYVIANGPALYEEIDMNNKAKVARIISEAYYAVNDTDKAKYYFELYSLSGTNLSRNDNFYAGMISYTLGNFTSAAEAFAKVASNTDSLGQSAAYHMGQSYIQLKNKHAAQKAFKMASESSFDESIKEDAFFNYAKLSFDISRNTAPFNEYLNSYRYTNSKWDEIHSYIATEYLVNGNFAPAIEALGKIKNATPYTTVTLQKASFFRAMQLIKSGAFSDAITHLEQSVKNGYYNHSLRNLGRYWMAECYYRKDMYDNSIELLTELQKNNLFKQSGEWQPSIYNLAYNYFKKGEYPIAAETFNTYINLDPRPQEYINEAGVRLADCYFMMKEYRKAAELYEQIAIDEEYKDLYPPLQSAIAYGLVDEGTKKIALLQEITTEEHKDSPLYSSALYELGRTLVQNVEDEKAEKVLEKLIINPKDSSYYYKALLETGMINANRQKNEEAMELYKKIVAENPVSQEAQSALVGIENLYQQQNNTHDFLAYLESVGLSTIKSEDEKEQMLFNAAEQTFLGEDYQGALNSLLAFISKYPNGTRVPQANFYIAECYSKLGKTEKAGEYYYKVMESGEGAFSEISTLNYGRISYSMERYDQAAKAYETLYKIALLGNNKIEAQTGKIRSYFMCRNYEQTLVETDKLLAMQDIATESNGTSNKDIAAELKQMATYYSAKSHLALGNRESAIPLLQILAKKPAEAMGAEAAYLLIQDAFDAGNFESVEKQTFTLSDSQTPQTYWLAKSFITLGDSYAERGNFEQAEATLNSIKENYSPENDDDIADLLKLRLNKLHKMKK